MTRSLLIVDDDSDLREFLSRLFLQEGYTVHVAESGEAALAMLDVLAVQVFLIDYRMGGMTGFELCRRIKQRNPAAITIAMSGHLHLFTLVELRETGFDDFLEKPFDFEALRSMVRGSFERLARWRRMSLKASAQ